MLHFASQKWPALLVTQAPAIGESNASLFLLRLQHVQPPIRVSCPEELRLVSVLLATGLIDAEVLALEATVRYTASGIATVVRITEAGLREIAKMGHWRELAKVR